MKQIRFLSFRVLSIGLLASLGGAAVFASACSSTSNNTFDNPSSSGAGAADAASTSGTGGGASTSTSSGFGGGDLFMDAGVQQSLVISPINPKLKVEIPLMGQTVQFKCLDANTMADVPGVTWKISVPDLGTLSASGLFTPNGLHTGEALVTCSLGMASAATKITVFGHAVDNPQGVTPAQQMLLTLGGPGQSDAAWQFLYPYDETVFPKGVLAPEIQLTSGSLLASIYFVHVVTPTFEYEGWFNQQPNSVSLQMSQQAWDALTNSANGQKVEVQITKLSNGQKVGPIFRHWTLANGTLHGTIYYNTYDSPLAGNTGAMMRIKGNSPQPDVFIGNCTVCHSISSDGSTGAAANHSGNGGVFDLTVSPPQLTWSTNEDAAFAGLYPKKGEVLVTNGAPGPNTPGTGGVYTSSLHTKNGSVIPNSGIESYYAQSPVFSHDGKYLSFTDRSGVSPYTSVLAMFAYDAVNQKFTNYQILGTPPQGHHFSWPAFTPDSKFVYFQNGTGDDLATWSGNTGKIFAINTQTKVMTQLANLNGDGYVPQGARDQDKNYEPTMAPIASGGHFWLMFTSRRTYGNKLTGDPSQTKRLWVSAIDINAVDGMDPSHPPFYIAGQELTSGNSRGFWALDPCKNDGSGCATGDECCTGFCNAKGNPPEYLCGPPDGSCSKEFENCQTDADCCDATLLCIGGKCSQLPPK